MQKLVTIYLDNEAYASGKWLTSGYKDAHGIVEEHLQESLEEGWCVREINAFGGHSTGIHVRGWIVAVLERES